MSKQYNKVEKRRRRERRNRRQKDKINDMLAAKKKK
jgi:hypothetical protein